MTRKQELLDEIAELEEEVSIIEDDTLEDGTLLRIDGTELAMVFTDNDEKQILYIRSENEECPVGSIEILEDSSDSDYEVLENRKLLLSRVSSPDTEN